MARPRKSKEQVRSVNFTVRLTEDEQQRLEKAAEACGIAPGMLIRQRLFKGKFPQPKIARIELDTYLQLKKAGVNLNQLTRLANGGRVGATLFQILMQLKQQQEIIINQIINSDRKSENR